MPPRKRPAILAASMSRRAGILRLAAVDRFHVQGMAEREGDRFAFAEIGEPIPGEHALDAYHQAGAERRNGVAKGVGAGRQIAFEDGLAGMIENVREHVPCVQIDAGIELLFVEPCHFVFASGSPQRARNVCFTENPKLSGPEGPPNEVVTIDSFSGGLPCFAKAHCCLLD